MQISEKATQKQIHWILHWRFYSDVQQRSSAAGMDMDFLNHTNGVATQHEEQERPDYFNSFYKTKITKTCIHTHCFAHTAVLLSLGMLLRCRCACDVFFINWCKNRFFSELLSWNEGGTQTTWFSPGNHDLMLWVTLVKGVPKNFSLASVNCNVKTHFLS